MLLLLVLACSVSEDSFPDAFAGAACTRLERCDKGAYQTAFDDRSACVDAWSSLAQIYLDAGNLLGASYDPKAGGQCVHDLRSADCDALQAGAVDCSLWE